MNLRGSTRLLFLLAGGATKTHVRKMGVLFVLLVSLAAASASATTINFASLQTAVEDTSLPGALIAGTLVTQQGFDITSLGGSFNVWEFSPLHSATSPNFPGTSYIARRDIAFREDGWLRDLNNIRWEQVFYSRLD